MPALATPITLDELINYRDTNVLKIRRNIQTYIDTSIRAFAADIDIVESSEPHLSDKALKYFDDPNNCYVLEANEFNRFLTGDASDPDHQHLQFDYLLITVGSLPANYSGHDNGVQTVMMTGCSLNAAGQYVPAIGNASLLKPVTEIFHKKITLSFARRFLTINRKIKMHTRAYTTDAIKINRAVIDRIEPQLSEKALNYLNDAHNIYVFHKDDLNYFLTGQNPEGYSFNYIMIIVGSLFDNEPPKDQGEQTIVLAGCTPDSSSPTGYSFQNEAGQSLTNPGKQHPPRLYRPSFTKKGGLKVTDVTQSFRQLKK